MPDCHSLCDAFLTLLLLFVSFCSFSRRTLIGLSWLILEWMRHTIDFMGNYVFQVGRQAQFFCSLTMIARHFFTSVVTIECIFVVQRKALFSINRHELPLASRCTDNYKFISQECVNCLAFAIIFNSGTFSSILLNNRAAAPAESISLLISIRNRFKRIDILNCNILNMVAICRMNDFFPAVSTEVIHR